MTREPDHDLDHDAWKSSVRRYAPFSGGIMRLATLSLIAAAILTPASAAHAFTGTYYVNAGTRSIEQLCQDIEGVFKEFGPAHDAPSRCVVRSRQEGYLPGSPGTTQIQLRQIHGAFYDMVYDLPDESTKYDFSAFLVRSGLVLFQNVGVSRNQTPEFQQAQAAAEGQAIARHEAGGPRCKSIIFSGYAAFSSGNLIELASSKHPGELLAENPLICTSGSYGGHYYNGALINPTLTMSCHGAARYQRKSATVVDWSDDGRFYHVQIMVDFDVGRRPAQLYIRRQDASCAVKAR